MNKKTIAIILCCVGFVLGTSIMIFLIATDFNIDLLDAVVRDFFYDIRGEKYGAMYWIFRILTELGFLYVILVLWFLFSIFTKGDIRCAVIGFGSIVTWVLNTSIKACFLRERPVKALRWMDESSSSFPSGHSMSATFFYGMLVYYIFNSNSLKKRTKKISLVCISFIVPIVMISRMVLGVHYFTDVITGFAYGLVCVGLGILVDIFLQKKGFRFFRGIIQRRKNKASE